MHGGKDSYLAGASPSAATVDLFRDWRQKYKEKLRGFAHHVEDACSGDLPHSGTRLILVLFYRILTLAACHTTHLEFRGLGHLAEDVHPHLVLHSLGEEVVDPLPLLHVQVVSSFCRQDLIFKKMTVSILLLFH